MRIFTVVIRAHDIPTWLRQSTGDCGWPTTALEVHMPWITRDSWFPEVALARSHPPPSVLGVGGRKLRPLSYHDEAAWDCAALRTIAPGPARAIVSPRRFAARLDV